MSKCWKQEKTNWREIALFQPKLSLFGCTGLSGGAPNSVRCARLTWREEAALGNSPTAYGYNSPDCPVCTGLSGEPTVSRANGRPRNPRATRGKCQRSDGAPDCPVCTGQCLVCQRLPDLQRSASPSKERNRAPDCPVRPMTEGKISLPELLSTAPSCLGAIKGTPRRMEE